MTYARVRPQSLRSEAKAKRTFLPWIGFLISFLLHILWNYKLFFPNSGPDEVGAMASAAYFAGYDWKGALSSQNYYYGFGSAWFLFPLFSLIESPFVIYYCMRLFLGLVISFPTVLAYKMMTNYFDIRDTRIVFFSSIACSFFTATSVESFLNEPMLILCIWVLFYFFVALQHTEKESEKAGLSFYATLVLCYSLTIHTRAILFSIIYGAVIFIYWMYTKRVLVNRIVVVATFVVGYVVANLFIAYIQNSIFGKPGTMHNSSGYLYGGITNTIPMIISFYGIAMSIRGVFNLIISNLLGASVYSIGTILAASCMLVIRWVQITKKTLKTSMVGKKGIEEDVFFPALFSFGCFFVALIGHSVLFMYHGIEVIDGNIGDGRYFFYLRYYCNYLGPLLMFLIIYLYKKKISHKVVFLSSVMIMCILALLFYLTVFSDLRRNELEAFDVGKLFSAFLFKPSLEEPFSYGYYFAATAVSLLLFSLLYLVFWAGKGYVSAIILTALLFYQQSFTILAYRRPIVEDAYTYYDGTRQLFNEHPEYLDEIETIQAYSTHTYRLHLPLQLLLYDKNVTSTTNGEFKENSTILISNDNISDDVTLVNYEVAEIDDNEYLYIKGEHMAEVFAGSGLEFETVEFVPQHFNPNEDEKYFLRYTEEGVYYVPYLEWLEILSDGGIQYGPYITLLGGRYSVTVHGENLLKTNFTITTYSGAVQIPYQIIQHDSETLEVEFELPYMTRGVEFVNRYTNDQMVIYGIDLDLIELFEEPEEVLDEGIEIEGAN